MLKKEAVKENFKILTKKEPEKRLLLRLTKKAGRGARGRITCRHKGGGVKKLYRIIDFGQEKLNIKAKVEALEYDPYRSAFIALLRYEDGDKRYRIAPQDLKVGDEVICAEKTELKTGNRMKLKHIPVGTLVYNIEIIPGQGGKMVRGAGTSARVVAQERESSPEEKGGSLESALAPAGAKEKGYTHLEMPSGEIRKVLWDCFASLGAVSRPEHIYRKLGKAGRARRKGKRPTVRGSAMIPPDHPHGGGEGKAPVGLIHPKTPWGKPARGVRTRKRDWTDKYIIQPRRKK